MKNAALELKSVAKTFGSTNAVDGLSLAIKPGEMYGLIGPNGSGKTTTLKMIVGIYRPTRGRILVRGIDASAAPTKAKRHLGYVPDDPAAYDLLTGKEFLEFVGELYGMSRAERDARIAVLLADYKLGPLADGLFAHYSRGTKQKFSLAAALLHRPSVLLIDEPMVGLDPESARVTKTLLTDFVQQGGAVLLSTHTLSVADEICDRFGVIKAGKLVAEGTHAELSAQSGRLGTLEDVYLALTADV
ncbi:MAG TPA: ABC transporter ATP-binding protein [Patescibacteria group bacterium]|nr:ABC transporter ATP-binding protein [Patescibacteria group bacterium]